MDPIKIKLGIETAAAAESIREFLRETKQALEGGVTTSVEKAKKSFDDLGRKILQIREIIEQNKVKQQSASQQEQESIKKIIQQRELEILRIQEKRTKLGELISLSNAGSDAERQALRNAVSDRMVEIGAMKDQIRAQMGINTEVNRGAGALDGYFGKFLGIGGIIAALNLVKQSFEGQREEIQRIIAATEHFRQINVGQFQTYKPFFNQFGVVGQGGMDQATKALENIRTQNPGISQETLSETSAGLAATLKESGITDVNGAQFQGLVGNAARYVDKGMGAPQISNYLFEQLKANPNLSGGELNQQLSNIVANAGSTQRATELLETYYSRSRIMGKAAHFGLNDIQKMWIALRNQGEAPDQIGNDISRYLQGMDRLLGMNRKERMDKEMLLAQNGVKIRLPRSAAEIPAFAQKLAGLSEDKRNLVATDFGGPRAAPVLSALGNFSSVSLQTGTVLASPDNRVQASEAAAESVQAQAAAAHPTSVGETTFRTEVEQRMKDLQDYPQKLPFYLQGGVLGGLSKMLTFAPNLREVASGQQRAIDLIRLARRRQTATGAEATQLDALLKESYEGLIGNENDPRIGRLRALAFGTGSDWSGNNYTRAGILQGITDDEAAVLNEDLLPLGSIKYSMLHGYGSVADPHTAGAIRDKTPSPTTRPTTRPSTPVSVNYNVRQVNYGMGYDVIGAPVDASNRYG